MINLGNSKVSLTPAGEKAVVEIIASVTPTESSDSSNVNVQEVLQDLSDRGLIKVEPEPEKPVFKGFGRKS